MAWATRFKKSWTSKSTQLQGELRRVRAEMERYEKASDAYEAAGLGHFASLGVVIH